MKLVIITPEEMYLEQKLNDLEATVSNLKKEVGELRSGLLVKQNETMLDTNVVADRLGMSLSAVLYHLRKNNLRGVKTCDSKFARYVVPESELIRYMDKLRSR